MHMTTQAAPSSSGMAWTGRILTGLVTLFLIFDSSVKLLKTQQAVQATVQLGYPENTIVPIGVALLVCLVLYLIPRTAILGGILMTGYLGGATATMVRVSSPWILFPVFIGVLAWAGIYLRDPELRRLIPFRK